MAITEGEKKLRATRCLVKEATILSLDNAQQIADMCANTTERRSRCLTPTLTWMRVW